MATSMNTHGICSRNSRHCALEICKGRTLINQSINIWLVGVCFSNIGIQVPSQASRAVVKSVRWLSAREGFSKIEKSKWNSHVDKRATCNTTTTASMRQDNTWPQNNVAVIDNHCTITRHGVFGSVEERAGMKWASVQRPIPVSCNFVRSVFSIASLQTYGCVPVYPHSFWSACSYRCTNTLCHGRKKPLICTIWVWFMWTARKSSENQFLCTSNFLIGKLLTIKSILCARDFDRVVKWRQALQAEKSIGIALAFNFREGSPGCVRIFQENSGLVNELTILCVLSMWQECMWFSPPILQ